MFTIVISEKGGAERRETFDKNEINIGRVQGNDLMLPKGNVSKHHARLLFRDGRFIVTDLKSTNGTYVNGRKISQATIVREGDKIYIGDFVLRVETGAGQQQPAADGYAGGDDSSGRTPARIVPPLPRDAGPAPMPSAAAAVPPAAPIGPPPRRWRRRRPSRRWHRWHRPRPRRWRRRPPPRPASRPTRASATIRSSAIRTTARAVPTCAARPFPRCLLRRACRTRRRRAGRGRRPPPWEASCPPRLRV
jgi:predicted component of type VI protein secretion system